MTASINVVEHKIRLGPFALDSSLWLRGWISLQRLVLASIILLAHRGYRELLEHLFRPANWGGFERLLDVSEGVAVVALTIWLLAEAIRVFLPPPWGISIEVERHHVDRLSGSRESRPSLKEQGYPTAIASSHGEEPVGGLDLERTAKNDPRSSGN